MKRLPLRAKKSPKPSLKGKVNQGKITLRRLNWLKNPRYWVATVLLTSLLVVLLSPLNSVFDRDSLVKQFQNTDHCAACLFIVAHILLTVVCIPGTVLTVAGGVVFGLYWGTIWSAIGATLGAVGAFGVARYLFHDWASKRFGRYPMLQRFHVAVRGRPWQFVLLVRLVPITPFNLVNFLFGLTPVPVGIYALGTLVGIIPGTLAFTWLGVTGKAALQGGDRAPFFLALGLLLVLCLLPLAFKRNLKA